MSATQAGSQRSLWDAYRTVLGGVTDCSERRYENSLQAIGRIVGRPVDAVFRAEIKVIESRTKQGEKNRASE